MTIRLLHDHTLSEIEKLCKYAESHNQKIKVSFSIYHEEDIVSINLDGTRTIQTEDSPIYAFSHQIKSAQDIFQFDNEDIKILTDRTKEELR